MKEVDPFIPVVELEVAVAIVSAFKPAPEGVKVADALASSGREISVPRVAGPADPTAAFLAIALGSNFPPYAMGES